jgi:hypothetical protein
VLNVELVGINNLPILNAHDPAINNGAAITIKRVSIIDSPF